MDHTVIAVAQLAVAIGEPDANRKAAAAAVAEAAAARAALVVLPELCDSGYVFGDDATRARAEAGALASPADDSPTLRQWQALAAEHGLVIVGGFCERGADGRLFNSAAVVDESGIRAVYRKAHLWDKEKLVFTPGDAPPPVVDLGFGRVGVMICYDLEFPEWVRLATLDAADLIAAPVNWPATAGAPKDGFSPRRARGPGRRRGQWRLRRRGRPLPGRTRRGLDRWFGHHRPERQAAGRPRPGRPVGRAHRRL